MVVTRHLHFFKKKGGKAFIRILENLLNLDQLAQVFQEENCPVQTLHENGVRILLAIYNAPQSENSIDNLRYTEFIKSTKLNKPVQLSNIPPTRAAAHQHISCVYYQNQTWLGNHLEPQEGGWILRNEFLEPIMIILPPTPDELLKTIVCNCKNSCGSRCGCKKSGCNILQLVASKLGKLFSMLHEMRAISMKIVLLIPKSFKIWRQISLTTKIMRMNWKFSSDWKTMKKRKKKMNIHVRLIIKIFVKPLHIQISIVIIV
ncbi:uncharacterized protein TNIN_146161 [Trichonephila inaurata madagascariensis]|uniref:Uncharacterized protein n=1 Tax=Trichonephila inaurata madagascariensis TaxID=2747483 RepID=A0A8X7CSQ4_9ARAC|nr:uncharacterized protein TNIN_146161 [Trichonephila inaurata madagascariensis]